MVLTEITPAGEVGTWELDEDRHGGVHLQIDGNDVVYVDIDKDTGTAVVTVYASSNERGPILWRGTVQVTGHLTGEPVPPIGSGIPHRFEPKPEGHEGGPAFCVAPCHGNIDEPYHTVGG